jgi:D-alanyl-D-alanine dipeptidase
MSWTKSQSIDADQRARRQLLVAAMAAHGFKNYDKEWWHFSLIRTRRVPSIYDFPVTARTLH